MGVINQISQCKPLPKTGYLPHNLKPEYQNIKMTAVLLLGTINHIAMRKYESLLDQ